MNNTIRNIRPLSILLLALSTSAMAAVKPNPLFSDGAVLQQETPIPVWGTAKEGEKVTVKFDGQEVSATAKDGKWMVKLPAHQAGGPFTMTISGENTITITNVLVGEVWVCTGQSNMTFPLGVSFPLRGAANAAAEIPTANYPGLRMFTVPTKCAASPQEAVTAKWGAGKWVVCTPATAPSFSAVGYFFGRDLLKARSVPVGMIHSSVGGTFAQSWTSLAGLGKSPEIKVYTDRLTNAVATYVEALDEYRGVLEKFHQKYGSQAAAIPSWEDLPPTGPVSPFGENGGTATVLYNGMIAPLIPYAIRGVICYQGEANCGEAALYRTLFSCLIADWREKWGRGDFPFLFTQIAPHVGMFPEIREAQFLTLAKVTNTAMVVTTDVGEANDIHPQQKEPIGARLALAARALAYGEKIEYSGPLYQGVKIDGTRAIINFTHIGSGLMAKGGELRGFTIAAADKKFLPAKAEIAGDTVVVSSTNIPAPVAVRYGWMNAPDVNLCNKEGLPASPFRTDNP